MTTVERVAGTVEAEQLEDVMQFSGEERLEFANKEEERTWMYTASTTASRLRAGSMLDTDQACYIGTKIADILTRAKRHRVRKPTPKPAPPTEGAQNANQ